MKSVLAAASAIKDTPRHNDRDHIPTPTPDRNLGEGSSGSNEVAFGHDHFEEGFAHSNSHSGEFPRVQAGTLRTLRQHSSMSIYFPPACTCTLSRSGTPSYPGLPRPACCAVCWNGQRCHSSASLGSDVYQRHTFESSFS